jgi:hypothetical protein
MARVYLLNEAAGMLRPSPHGRVDGVTRDVSPMAEFTFIKAHQTSFGA